MLYLYIYFLIAALAPILTSVLSFAGIDISFIESIINMAIAVLFIIGLTQIMKYSEKLKLARNITIAVIGFNIFSTILFSTVTLSMDFIMMHGVFASIAVIAMLALSIYSKYLTGQGIIEIEKKYNADIGAEKLAKAINTDIALVFGAFVTLVIGMIIPPVIFVAGIISFIGMFYPLYVAYLMYNTYKLSEPILAGNPPTEFVNDIEKIEETIPENIPEPISEPEAAEETFDAGDEISVEDEADGGEKE